MRGTRSAVVLALVGASLVATPTGAQIPSPVEPSSDFSMTETATVSPLTPGVASDVKYTTNDFLPLAPTDEGFARLTDDGDDFTLDEINGSGVVTSTIIETSGSIDIQYVVDRVTADHVLLRRTVFDGGTLEFVSSLTARLDRATGELIALPLDSQGLSEPAQMTYDGSLVASYIGDDRPIVATIENGGVTTVIEWDDDDFDVEDPQPHLHPEGSHAAVLGSPVGDGAGELWIRSLDGGEDRRLALPCPSLSCSFDLRAFTAFGDSGTVFYSVDSDGPDVGEPAEYKRVDVATGEVSDGPPITVGSPTGRFGIGPALGDDGALSDTELGIHDLLNGRSRTVAADLQAPYVVRPVSISEDGTSVRYVASVRCLGVCVFQPSYFGSFDLSPVADVTRGPAEDEILRLYRAVFGRIPDTGGFEYWINQYREGEPLLDIAAAFAASDEFVARYGTDLTDEELIDALYQNVLDRSGDVGGVAFWLELRGGGASVAELLVRFANSPENIERTGTREPISAPVGRVLRIYRAMLGREPDEGGLAFWVGRYNDDLSLAEMAEQFTFQPEFGELYGANPSNADLVDAVYRNVLGRPGDEGGTAFWLDQLETGLTVPELFVSFADSPENIEATGTIR